MEQNRNEVFAKYQDEIHLLGRIGLTVGLGLLLGLPFAFGKVLNASVNWSAFWKGALQVLPVYLPSCVVEFMVYVPMMGAGASYLGFITGNMVNLKIPCVVNGRDICKPRDAMEKEIVATLSVAASALVNTVVLAVGVLCLAPLTPVLQNPVLQPAFNQVIPALFGALAYKYFSQSLRITAIPLALMCGLCIGMPSLIGSVATLMLGSGALAIAVAFVLWRTDKL